MVSLELGCTPMYTYLRVGPMELLGQLNCTVQGPSSLSQSTKIGLNPFIRSIKIGDPVLRALAVKTIGGDWRKIAQRPMTSPLVQQLATTNATYSYLAAHQVSPLLLCSWLPEVRKEVGNGAAEEVR